MSESRAKGEGGWEIGAFLWVGREKSPPKAKKRGGQSAVQSSSVRGRRAMVIRGRGGRSRNPVKGERNLKKRRGKIFNYWGSVRGGRGE